MTDLEQRLTSLPDGAARLDLDRLQAELARRAARAGILDVAYASADSPLGELTIFVTPRGVVRVAYENEPDDLLFEELSDGVSPRLLRDPGRTDAARAEIEDYFEGRRQSFDLPIDWSLVHGFAVGVLQATARVPFGEVSSYGEVAAEAGSPRAARAAGNALASNPIPIVVPCHRILHADGGLGGYSGGLDRKRFLLRHEGTLPARR
jgi:methylated-DNA-[protein]-cysteine S-methyltransferase